VVVEPGTIEFLAELVRASTARSEDNGRALAELTRDVAVVRERLGPVAEAIGGQGPNSMPGRLTALEIKHLALQTHVDRVDERKWQAWLAIAIAVLGVILSWIGSHSTVTIDAKAPPAEQSRR